jgi:hypothetical protein
VGAIQSTGTLAWAIFDTSSQDKIDQALALEPQLLTMIRVADVAGLEAQLAHFAAHPPVIVEIDAAVDAAAIIPSVHAAGNRAFTDVFTADIGASLSGNLAVYDIYEQKGFDILQTERPDLVLEKLGRWPPPPQP